MIKKKWKKAVSEGLIAAPYTPMDPDGRLYLDPVSDYASFLIEKGVRGVFICGTSGEGPSLSISEKKSLLDEWVRKAAGKLEVIFHVGGVCQSDSEELSRHAAESGADGVAALSPFFFKPNTAAELIRFLKPIASAAPELPFYYYHIPFMSGIQVPASDILLEATDHIPNLCGIKYTCVDMVDLQKCLRIEQGKYQMMFGFDELLIAGLQLGITSAIGSTYNYMARVYLDLMRAFRNGDMQKALEYQYYSVQVVDVLKQHGGPVRTGKAIMELAGVNCGPCRVPFDPFTSSEKLALKDALNSLDFFNRI